MLSPFSEIRRYSKLHSYYWSACKKWVDTINMWLMMDKFLKAPSTFFPLWPTPPNRRTFKYLVYKLQIYSLVRMCSSYSWGSVCTEMSTWAHPASWEKYICRTQMLDLPTKVSRFYLRVWSTTLSEQWLLCQRHCIQFTADKFLELIKTDLFFGGRQKLYVMPNLENPSLAS